VRFGGGDTRYLSDSPTNGIDPYGLINIGDAFAAVDMAIEPYVVAGGMVVSGAVVAGVGAAAAVAGYGAIPATGPTGAIVGTAGVGTTVGGVGILSTGIDIYSDQLRHTFDLPDWFDLIPEFDFFPPHDHHKNPCD